MISLWPLQYTKKKFYQPKVSIVIAKIDGVNITLSTEEFDSYYMLFKILHVHFNCHNLKV